MAARVLPKNRVEVYRRPDHRFGWRRIRNGRVTGTDGNQGYSNREFCLTMARKANSDIDVFVLISYARMHTPSLPKGWVIG